MQATPKRTSPGLHTSNASSRNMYEYVWYASYGSNLSRLRFMAYIQGGPVPGSAGVVQEGCSDRSAPLQDEAVMIPFPLFFPLSSYWWKGGVAAIDVRHNMLANLNSTASSSSPSHSSSSSSISHATTDKTAHSTTTTKVTRGRMYLIKMSQFIEVVAQENGVAPSVISSKLGGDFWEQLEQRKVFSLLPSRHYGTLVWLGRSQEGGYPILTFTVGLEFLRLAKHQDAALSLDATTVFDDEEDENTKVTDTSSLQTVDSQIDRKYLKILSPSALVECYNPSVAYLRRMAVGLKQKHGMTVREMADYFIECGAQYTVQQLYRELMSLGQEEELRNA